MSDSYCYVAKVPNKLGNGGEQLVGPFDSKVQARLWLEQETGTPTGGLVMLVLPPQS